MAHRTDRNHMEVIGDLRAVGASVHDTSMVGNGFGDCVVGYRGENWILEIKDGKKAPSARKLTPAEKKFHATWRGQVNIVKNSDEALRLIGAIK